MTPTHPARTPKIRESRARDLTKGPVSGLVAWVAVPSSVGFFFHTMFNVVDTYYGGRLSTTALAAMSLSFPVFMVLLAAGHGLSTGATALIGAELGKDDRKSAAVYGMQSISFGIFAAIVMAAAGFLFAPPVFRALGATGHYLTEAMEYVSIIFLGSVFFIANYALNAILNAQGDTRSFRNFLIAGFFLNLILDPLFVFGWFAIPRMGLPGIAFATVTVEAVGVAYLAHRVHKTGLLSHLDRRFIRPRLGPYLDIAFQGFPAGLNFATIALGIFVIQYFISWFGADAIAAYGIGMRVEQMVLVPTIGLSTAALSISAQNYGAGRFDRVFETRGRCLFYGLVISLAGGVVVFAGAGFFMELFSDDPRVVAIGATYLRIDALVLYAYVVLFVNISTLQGVKKPLFAVGMGVFRQIAAPAAVFYLFVRILDWKLLGVWWGIFAVTWFAAGVAFFYTGYRLRGMEQAARPTSDTA